MSLYEKMQDRAVRAQMRHAADEWSAYVMRVLDRMEPVQAVAFLDMCEETAAHFAKEYADNPTQQNRTFAVLTAARYVGALKSFADSYDQMEDENG